MDINVIKRNGSKEPLDLDKFHKVAHYACEGLAGVSVSELELKTHLQFYNNIKTTDIAETLIKSAADLITEATPNYQFVAARLVNYELRKQVYNQFDPPSLYDHVCKVVRIGRYDPELLKWYSKSEFDVLDEYIDHDRDFKLSYAGMEQLRGKYLVKDRVKKNIFETPQMAFMLISMSLFHKYEFDRMNWVKDMYDALSTFYISLPTPIMAGLRTSQRQFSSCVLIETDDTLDSIGTTTQAILQYVSRKAGIGLGGGRLRASGSPIRLGDAVHTGVIPFYRLMQSAVKSCSQGGVRGGAATIYYPLWHLEVEDLLVLKNNKGRESTRLRQLDYGVQFNKVMYERLLSGGNITLFSPHDVPDLYNAFFTDVDLFRTLYEKYERAHSIRKKTIPAKELFTSFMQERKETGRLYVMNVDHCNTHGSFIHQEVPIRMSNLCAEITLPTVPLQDLRDKNGEISLCTLGAINWGKIKSPEEFEKPCTLLVRALDEVLSFQDYPLIAAERSTINRRPLGVGIINLAYWMAKNNMTYTDPNLNMIHEYAEAWSYYLIKASADLAQEKGGCDWGYQTKYNVGILPIDTYKKDVDDLVKPSYKMPWNKLRSQLSKYGIRNSTLMAGMPAETSSQISNATNGIEPPKELISIKGSKDGSLKQVVPSIQRLKNKYELVWDQKSPLGYLKICAVLQKFIDQAISVNTSYNPAHYPGELVPMSEMLEHLLIHYKYGGKTLYYCNTNDGAGEEDMEGSILKSESVVSYSDEECVSCIL